MLLLRRAELLKRRLGAWPSSEIRVPVADGEEDRVVTLTSAEAADAFKPLLDRMVAPCRAALRGADVELDALDDVVLVGGATRMPSFVDLAGSLFGRPARAEEDPDFVVARGPRYRPPSSRRTPPSPTSS